MNNAKELTQIAKDADTFNTAIPVIEDAAHVLTTTGKDGTFGDLIIHSFGPEKPISCIRGGVVVARNNRYTQTLQHWSEQLHTQPFWLTWKLFFTGKLFALMRPLYQWWIGKYMLYVSRKLQLIKPIISPKEVRGEEQSWRFYKQSKLQKTLLGVKLAKLTLLNSHRKMVASRYASHLSSISIAQTLPDTVWLDYPIVLRDTMVSSKTLVQRLKKLGILVSPSWLGAQIVPAHSTPALTTDELAELQSSTVARMVLPNLLVLPTHRKIHREDADRIAVTITNIW